MLGYYVFGGELVNSLAAMQIRDGDSKSLSASDGLGPLPPPSSSSPHQCWSNPYSSASAIHQHQPNLAPIYAPMPYMSGGYDSNAYSYPQEPTSLHSGSGNTLHPTVSVVSFIFHVFFYYLYYSGGSSNDTAGSRRERQHLVRDNHHSHGMPLGFSAPPEIRSIDSDSGSNRSKKSGSSVLQQQLVHPPHSHNMMPGGGPSYVNHANGDSNNHNNPNFHSGPPASNKPSEFFIDVM